jgi:hypothetical protein
VKFSPISISRDQWSNSYNTWLPPKRPGFNTLHRMHFCIFFKNAISFRRFCDFGGTRGKEGTILNENLRLKLQLSRCNCISHSLARSPENFPYFYLIKMKNPTLFKPFFGLLFAFKGHQNTFCIFQSSN